MQNEAGMGGGGAGRLDTRNGGGEMPGNGALRDGGVGPREILWSGEGGQSQRPWSSSGPEHERTAEQHARFEPPPSPSTFQQSRCPETHDHGQDSRSDPPLLVEAPEWRTAKQQMEILLAGSSKLWEEHSRFKDDCTREVLGIKVFMDACINEVLSLQSGNLGTQTRVEELWKTISEVIQKLEAACIGNKTELIRVDQESTTWSKVMPNLVANCSSNREDLIRMVRDSSMAHDEIIKLRAELQGIRVEISASLAKNSREQNDIVAKLQIKVGAQDAATRSVQAQMTEMIAENTRQNNDLGWAMDALGTALQSEKEQSLGFAQTIASGTVRTPRLRRHAYRANERRRNHHHAPRRSTA